jgi:hypothetical protein
MQSHLPLADFTDEQFDAAAIRSIYEPLLDRCARLTAYAQPSERYVHWPVFERQERLATDDLIVFSLYARRFFHATSLVTLAHNVVIPLGLVRFSGQETSMWRVINTIIHNDEVFIFRDLSGIRSFYNALRDRIHYRDFLIDQNARLMSPQVFVSSDHFIFAFDLAVLLGIFNERILRTADDVCSTRGIELI